MSIQREQIEVATPAEPTQISTLNHLHCQPDASARIDPFKLSGAVANRLGSPPAGSYGGPAR